jgi:hypothetical protein
MCVRLALLASLLACAAAAPGAGAYHFHAVTWPGGVVPYFNAAPDQAWAVSRAVRAWNESGARVRFVAVPRSRAKLVIQEEPDHVYCTEGRATVGDVAGAHVEIFPARGITHACNRYWAARVMTHELGHVLGLLHEDRVCAAMNASGTLRGGAECDQRAPWDWRCRLLERDDVQGAVAAYGGRARPVRTPAVCPLYPAIGRPTGFSASVDPGGGSMTLTFTRPADPAIPSFAAAPPWTHNAAFAITQPRRSCPADDAVADAYRYHWSVPPGGRQRLRVAAPSRRLCLAVWAIDPLGRPSAGPARIMVGPPPR